MKSLNAVSNGTKTVALVLFVAGLFVFGSSYFENSVIRGVFAAPLIVLTILQFFFRYPDFMNQAFYEAAERDASRGLLSIKNLGLLIILMFGALLYIAD